MNVSLVYVRDENFCQLLPEEPNRSRSEDERIKVMAFPPLGIQTLAPVLRQRGHRVWMFDTCHPQMKAEHIAQAIEKEGLDVIALSVKPATEDRRIDTVRHGANISPRPAFGEARAKGVGIISPVRQENGSGPHGAEHVLGAAPVMGLAGRELERNGQTRGIDERVDLRRQAAPRATHATGSALFFLPFAAC